MYIHTYRYICTYMYIYIYVTCIYLECICVCILSIYIHIHGITYTLLVPQLLGFCILRLMQVLRHQQWPLPVPEVLNHLKRSSKRPHNPSIFLISGGFYGHFKQHIPQIRGESTDDCRNHSFIKNAWKIMGSLRGGLKARLQQPGTKQLHTLRLQAS